MNTALILSGGGSKGDFELGAVRYLYEFLHIYPDVKLISGTSVGAINGAKLAEGEVSPLSGLRGLKRAWYTLDLNTDMWDFEPWLRNADQKIRDMVNNYANLHRNSHRLPSPPSLLPKDNTDWGGLRDLANGISNFFWLIGAGINFGPTIAAGAEAQSLANLNPIRAKLYGIAGAESIFDINLVTQWANTFGAHLMLACVSLDSGELRFMLETGELVDRKGWPVVNKQTNQFVRGDVREGVVASASIGMVFPPVKLGDEYYVDGGHRSVLPVDALFHGANKDVKKAYLISTSPLGLVPVKFETQLQIGNIAARSMMETFLAEIEKNEVEPRGGWGDRQVTVIAPSFEVHSMTLIDPGMIRINADYGWMKADDAVNNRDKNSRLFKLTDDIIAMRSRIWFEEGRYLGSFGNIGLGEFNRLPGFRDNLAALVEERRSLGGNMPAGAQRWAQTGEAHSTGFGGTPVVNIYPVGGAGITATGYLNADTVVYIMDSHIGGSAQRNNTCNAARSVIYSTSHQEPMVSGKTAWRTTGRSKLPYDAEINALTSGTDLCVLLGTDEDGVITCAELQPDKMAFSGWLPIAGGIAKPGSPINGISRRKGSLDIFVTGTDGKPYTAARHTGMANWGGWWPLPVAGFPLGSPVTAVSRNTDLLDVFGIDNSGNIITAAWSPGAPAWGGWWIVSNGKFIPGGYVACVSADTDVIDLFAVGTDGNMARSFWSPSTQPWQPWVSLAATGLRFVPGSKISAISPSRSKIEIACIDNRGKAFSTIFEQPLRTFAGFTAIGTKVFAPNAKLVLVLDKNSNTQAFCVGTDHIVYKAIRMNGQTSWSDWTAYSNSLFNPIVTPPANDSPFQDGTMLSTTDSADQIRVIVEPLANRPDTVEFVLEAGPGIDWEKQIVLVEGPTTGTGKWTIKVVNNINRDSNGLFANQLPGGRLEFRKAKELGIVKEVLRVDISKVKPGTRIIFQWVRD